MSKGKLILEADFEESFELVAIHCSLEPYRICYFINRKLGLKLERIEDVTLFQKQDKTDMPLFYYNDEIKQTEYFLIANKSKVQEKQVSDNSLFDTSESSVNVTLLNEFKNADYLLKIQDDSLQKIPLKRHLIELNQIKHIITAYSINTEKLKNKSRLVF